MLWLRNGFCYAQGLGGRLAAVGLEGCNLSKNLCFPAQSAGREYVGRRGLPEHLHCVSCVDEDNEWPKRSDAVSATTQSLRPTGSSAGACIANGTTRSSTSP